MREPSFDFGFDERGKGFVITADPTSLELLLIQTATVVLFNLTASQPKDPGDSSVRSRQGVKNYSSWSFPGYLDSFKEQVEFLYDFVCACVEEGKVSRFPLIKKDELLIIPEVLQKYQQIKTAVIAEQQANNPNFGSQTDFIQTDWTDHNQRFLELLS